MPLQIKLMLIGLIPFCFLIYLTRQVYNEKTEKLKLFNDYKQYIAESENIALLNNAMQEERKFSFDFVLTGNKKTELLLQRPKTNALLRKLEQSSDPALKGFIHYTKLKDLDDIRKKVDSKQIDANGVMHFYSNTVFRLNTLNTIPPANTAYLKPVFKELVAHKVLSEMITYFGIIRSNIYNVLLTRQYMVETLIGTYGTYEIYNSYEEEFLVKAPPQILAEYRDIKKNTAFGPTIDYTDKTFKTFAFDDTFTAQEWWNISDKGTDELRKLQSDTWKSLNTKINQLYKHEENQRSQSLVVLVCALGAMVLIVCYILFVLTQTLSKLKVAAERISNGETGLDIDVESADAIGGLAHSIRKIDRNNIALAGAAAKIGQGNFDIDIEPRSDSDLLVNAIIDMKNDLAQYNLTMEELVASRTEQLARSNDDLQQFAHVASHDLKEPLRKIATFSNILNEQYKQELSDKAKLYLEKIEKASIRMSVMIEGVLAYSMVSTDEQAFEAISLNSVMEDVKNDLELAIIQKDAMLQYGQLPRIRGIRILIYQLFYNLVSNSLKFSRESVPPVIDITSEKVTRTVNKKTGDFVHIIIKDNGIGFNPDYAERIFSVFSRLNAKEMYEGTGLGLALCRKIVLRHGGEITAESDEGYQSTFHIYLPELVSK